MDVIAFIIISGGNSHNSVSLDSMPILNDARLQSEIAYGQAGWRFWVRGKVAIRTVKDSSAPKGFLPRGALLRFLSAYYHTTHYLMWSITDLALVTLTSCFVVHRYSKYVCMYCAKARQTIRIERQEMMSSHSEIGLSESAMVKWQQAKDLSPIVVDLTYSPPEGPLCYSLYYGVQFPPPLPSLKGSASGSGSEPRQSLA